MEKAIFLLIIVKMPTIVGILTFMTVENFMLSWVEHENSFITLGPGRVVLIVTYSIVIYTFFLYTIWKSYIEYKI